MTAFRLFLFTIFLCLMTAMQIDTPITINNNMFTNGQTSTILFNHTIFFNPSNISSIQLTIYNSAITSIYPLQLSCIIDTTHYLATTIPIPDKRDIQTLSFHHFTHSNALSANSAMSFLLTLYIENNPFHNTFTLKINNNTRSSYNAFTSKQNIIITAETTRKHSPIVIRNVGSYLAEETGSQDKEEAYALAELLSYRVLYDHEANDTEKQQLIDAVGEARITVFNLSGYGEAQGNMKFNFIEQPRDVIHNHDGDMVVKYAEAFRQEDRIGVLNLSNSSRFQTQINVEMHRSTSNKVRTSSVFVLNEERQVFYLWKEKGAILDHYGLIILMVVISVLIVTICIAGAVCYHCRQQIDEFDKTLPMSKAHRQRVEEETRQKELEKKERKGYKTLAQNDNDGVSVEMTKP
eukprot:263550_1